LETVPSLLVANGPFQGLNRDVPILNLFEVP
jgi:hypothetical protein